MKNRDPWMGVRIYYRLRAVRAAKNKEGAQMMSLSLKYSTIGLYVENSLKL